MPPAIQCGGVAKTPGSSALLANIETIVVVMMENRSFDHHLGALRSDRSYPAATAVDGLRGSEECPDIDGHMVASWRLNGREARFVPTHQWDPSHAAFDGGRNDGFLQANPGASERLQVMGYHDREVLPVQYALADQYTVCDRWFASVMGPTWPNRFYLQATTSDGRRENRPMGFGAPATLWERMAERCRSTRNYFAAPAPWYAAAFPAKAFSGNDALVAARIEDFFKDARAGNLPEFALIDPDFLTSDGHPAHDLSLSEAFLSSVYKAMAESPQWSRSLLIVVYDEYGGFYDHVPPPQTADPRDDFRQLGFRVPAIVIGPTVWQGRVISETFEHVSVAATLRTRYGIESLGSRMDAARDLSACIDPARVNAPAAAPGKFPLVEVSQAQLTAALNQPPSQRELADAIDNHQVPEKMVDPRSQAERLDAWLRLAQELEAVKVNR
jgi:phospholipase C